MGGVGDRVALRGWLAAEAVSLTGTRLSMVALPWFVLTTTGSPTKTGLIALVEMTPLVLLKVLGGPVIDRAGARKVSIACDLGSVLAVGAVPLLHATDALTFPLLLALVAVAGALRGPGDAAKHALAPVLAQHAAVPMERVTGLSGAVERTASLVGAGAAGAAVAVLGPAQALALDAASFGISALVLAATTRALPRPAASRDPSSYAQQLREGWRFLRHDALLVAITVMVALTNLLDTAYMAVLVPVWARESGSGAGAIGLLFAVFSAGSLVGAVIAARWGASMPRFRTYLLGFLACGAPRFLVLAADVPLAVVLAVVAVAGFGSGFLNPILGAVIYERIPAGLVGRVSALTTALCFALMPLGGVVGGALAGVTGTGPALVACGLAYLVVTMLPAASPALRSMDRPPATARGAGPAPG